MLLKLQPYKLECLLAIVASRVRGEDRHLMLLFDCNSISFS